MLPLAGPSSSSAGGASLYTNNYLPPQQQQQNQNQQLLSYPYSQTSLDLLTMAQMQQQPHAGSSSGMPQGINQPNVLLGNASSSTNGQAPPPTFYPYGMPITGVVAPSVPLVAPQQSRFMATLNQVATQEMPKIESLARSALDGIHRAYEPDTDPAQTAVTLEALRSALANLYDLLKVSGVGALPLNPEPGEVEALLNSNSNPGGGGGRPGTDPRLAALTEQVNAIFKEGKAARERAAVVSDVMRSGGAHAGAGDGL